MYVLNTLNLVLRHCCTAHTTPYRDPHAGNFALEGTKHQRIVLKQVKPAQFTSARRSYNNALVFASVARKLVSPAINA
jgi:hypothetical protein